MTEEYNSLIENETWDLVFLPLDQNIFRCKWVYRMKKKTNGHVGRYKERLVAKGFQQFHSIDYDETFSLIEKMGSM